MGNKVGGEGGKRGSEIEKGEGRESRRGWKIAFWNVAGLGNKDRNFWEELKEWEMVLSETWTSENDWKRMKENLPKGYEWGGARCREKMQERKGNRGDDNGDQKGVFGEGDKDRVGKGGIFGRESTGGRRGMEDS